MIDLASANNPASRPEWEKGDGQRRHSARLRHSDGGTGLFRGSTSPTMSRCCWAVCWEVVNDRDATAAQFRGAPRRRCTPPPRSIPPCAHCQTPSAQALAESIAYQVMIMFATKVSADRNGNQGAIGRTARQRHQGGQPIRHRRRPHAAHREGIFGSRKGGGDGPHTPCRPRAGRGPITTGLGCGSRWSSSVLPTIQLWLWIALRKRSLVRDDGGYGTLRILRLARGARAAA